MASKFVICVLLLAVVGCTFAKLSKKGKGSHIKVKKGYKTKPIPEVRPCDGMYCGAGRECIVTELQEPSCQCVQSCEAIEHIICGSDGITYPNKCELHRSACIQETKITQVKVGPCKVAPTVSHERPASPIVCYQEDRNVLHKQIVQFLQSKEMADGWFMKGKKYMDVVDEYFTLFDESGDEVIDNTEFMKFVESNDTVRNSTAQDENTEGENQLMRSMCVDALLTEADIDYDWRLNKQEFESCLRPDFEPGTLMCSLEGSEYADGEEVQNRCNECVCACGNWVCTGNACDGDMVAGTDAQEEYDPAEENAMNEKEWTAIMKKLAKVSPDLFPAQVRDLKHLSEELDAPHPPKNPMDNIMGEDFQRMELMAEEMAMDIEEQEEAAQIEEQPLPVVPALPLVPAQIDEGAVPPLEEEPVPRVFDRIRTGKRGDRKHKGKGKHGKRGHKSGGRGKN